MLELDKKLAFDLLHDDNCQRMFFLHSSTAAKCTRFPNWMSLGSQQVSQTCSHLKYLYSLCSSCFLSKGKQIHYPGGPNGLNAINYLVEV